MFNIPSTEYFPIFSFEYLFDFIFVFLILLHIPSLKETHLTIEEAAMCSLRTVAFVLAESFTIPKDIAGSVEDLFD